MHRYKVTVTLILLLASGAAAAKDCVVLLHGLARTASSFSKMEEALNSDGYVTANIDYPSRDHEVAELAEIAVGQGLAMCRAKDEYRKNSLSLPTHSVASCCAST